MTEIDRYTWGSLYLLHFDRPLGNTKNVRGMARHYLGWALDPELRIDLHLSGQSGVPIVAAALAAGIVITPHILGPSPKNGEWHLKTKTKNIAPFCPDCCAQKQARVRPLPFAVDQLELALFDEDEAFPDPPANLKMDSYEYLIRRSWQQAMPRQAIDLSAFDAF